MSAHILDVSEMPAWLTAVSVASLGVAVALAVWTAVDVVRRAPRMGVMAWVWPLTMLFGSVLWLVFYLRWGRAPRRGASDGGHPHGSTAMPVSVATGTSHCGAGCTLGDLVGESLVLLVPGLTAALGLHAVFSDDMYSRWVVDLVFALGFGIVFQYFTIAPMRGLGLWAGLRAAAAADVASIAAWQVGMYGVMAIAQLWALPHLLDGRAAVASPLFWAVMQVAMLAGFVTAYPVNWWLVRAGLKEAM